MLLKGLKLVGLMILLIVGSSLNTRAEGDFSERVANDFIRRFPDPDSIH
jgi:hypothetical protein